ncbi:MAG TPA: 1,2-phenylacetyl-CoA epoxidase subunit PaaE [Natronosporangium sp.]|nr:1,2-phenylacetyl-CoA epoxidase subunit PaaE [Natronosporangium sp.]
MPDSPTPGRSVIVTRPVRRRPTFHALPVSAVDQLTDDALAITFQVPEPLRDTFRFRAGQHLTVRRIDPDTGEDVRRSYSICSTPAELGETGRLRIGVKVLPSGAFSQYAANKLAVGDEVEVMPPLGHFTTDFDPARTRRYGGIVAGSGITPVLSLIATGLAIEPHSTFTLFYGNRSTRSVMFVEELADLKDRWPDRLQVVHVLSREPGEAELLSGRIDAQRLPRLLDTFAPHPVDEWFLCGPYGMVLDAREVLIERGVPEEAVRTELFHVPSAEPEPGAGSSLSAAAPRADATAGEVEVTIRLDGRESTFTMGRQERVLDAALRVRGELPYSCRGGVCSTCRARVVEGKVQMATNWALEPDEVAAGYVLTCQSSPVTDRLVVDYDV